MAEEGTPNPPASTPPPGPAPTVKVETKVEDGGKTLTQAEVDRIVADRVARERAKFADYGDLKSKAAKLDEIEAANASDLEKAVKKAREEGAAEVTARANARLLTAEARALAAEARFRNPNLAVKAVDLSDVTVADDGTVDTAAIKRLLDDLAKAEPYLVDDGKPARPKPDDAQGRAPAATPVATTTPGLGRLREAYAQTTTT